MNFKDRFEQFFKTADMSDEWVYSNFAESLLDGLDSAAAFKMIPQVVDFVLEQSDSYVRLQALGIILALAGRSGTTEMPPGVLEKMNAIEKLFLDSDYEKSQFNELKRFYRIN